MTMPRPLIDDASQGRLVLLLGAGASQGAVHPEGQNPPSSKQLADALAIKFLNKSYGDRPLSQVAELAVSETDLIRVQTFIRDLLLPFQPAAFHKLIPLIRWRALATTNYDLLVERAYEAVPAAVQRPAVFVKNGQRIDERLSTGEKSVVYLKLHGCITDIEDPNCPLILTPDQYLTHRKSRSRLFDRLKELAYEYSIVFVGNGMADTDIRAVLLELDTLGAVRPRFYLVSPSLTSADSRFWQNRRVTCIDATFETFLRGIDAAVPRALRGISLPVVAEHPIARHFAVSPNTPPSSALARFLEIDADYLHAAMPAVTANPRAFFKGYFTDWGPIQQHLDIERSVTERILKDLILPAIEPKAGAQELVLIKGHAGSGKSVVLHRLAWELATQLEQLVLFLKPSGTLSIDPFRELSRVTNKRVYLCVDGLADRAADIESLLSVARKERIPLTIIGSERYHEWNIGCAALEPYVASVHEVRYLSETEIGRLLQKLTEHGSLGHLGSMTLEQQRLELAEHAGRQLLVALHEATFGKPFGDIIQDEFSSIPSSEARALYLTVAILHRLRASARAGLISRIHGIPFKDFRARLFKPLEFIVFARESDSGGDIVYETRHPHVAELVFERVLVDADARFDEYMRVLSALDVDYSVDRDALLRLLNHRSVRDLFPDAAMVRRLYEAAVARAGEEPGLLQQRALFEMNADHGNLELAETLISRARARVPRNHSLMHSQAELALRRGQLATTMLTRRVFRSKAREIAQAMIQGSGASSFPYHTLLKVNLEELEELDANDPASIESLVSSFERTLARAVERFPDDEFIRDAEARFRVLLNDRPSALATLARAFSTNKHSAYLASRLARQYSESGRLEEAVHVLKEGLNANPNHKDLNFQLATSLARTIQGWSHPEIKFHLKRSFTKGDSNYLAQFWYARLLFLEGAHAEAAAYFTALGEADLPWKEKRAHRAPVLDDAGEPRRFCGVVTKVDTTYAFVEMDGSKQSAFAPCWASEGVHWARLSRGSRVRFELRFNYQGPVATAVHLERE
jgi:tetratricopeptide (TPR) repeat protein